MNSLTVAGRLVDSDLLLDLFTDDPWWCDCSETELADDFDCGAKLPIRSYA